MMSEKEREHLRVCVRVRYCLMVMEEIFYECKRTQRSCCGIGECYKPFTRKCDISIKLIHVTFLLSVDTIIFLRKLRLVFGVPFRIPF